MKTNPNEPLNCNNGNGFYNDEFNHTHAGIGLTKREYFAAMAYDKAALKLRDELADKVNKHFEKIGANTDDVFKYGFGACETLYLPMLEKLESALKFIYNATELSTFYRYDTLTNSHEFIEEALAELAEFKKQMNGTRDEN